MTVIGALSSFRELGEMSPHKRASRQQYRRRRTRVRGVLSERNVGRRSVVGNISSIFRYYLLGTEPS